MLPREKHIKSCLDRPETKRPRRERSLDFGRVVQDEPVREALDRSRETSKRRTSSCRIAGRSGSSTSASPSWSGSGSGERKDETELTTAGLPYGTPHLCRPRAVPGRERRSSRGRLLNGRAALRDAVRLVAVPRPVGERRCVTPCSSTSPARASLSGDRGDARRPPGSAA